MIELGEYKVGEHGVTVLSLSFSNPEYKEVQGHYYWVCESRFEVEGEQRIATHVDFTPLRALVGAISLAVAMEALALTRHKGARIVCAGQELEPEEVELLSKIGQLKLE